MAPSHHATPKRDEPRSDSAGVPEESLPTFGSASVLQAGRKVSPFFKDLNTAYTSITSRAGRFETASTSRGSITDDPTAIPLSERKPYRAHDQALAEVDLSDRADLAHYAADEQPIGFSPVGTLDSLYSEVGDDQSIFSECELRDYRSNDGPRQGAISRLEKRASLEESQMPDEPVAYMGWPRDSIEMRRVHSRANDTEANVPENHGGVTKHKQNQHIEDLQTASTIGHSTVANIYNHYAPAPYDRSEFQNSHQLHESAMQGTVLPNNTQDQDTNGYSSIDLSTNEAPIDLSTNGAPKHVRIPLMTVVSQALRRASGFSLYSLDALSPLKKVVPTGPPQLVHMPSTRQSEQADTKARPAGDFYNEDAIAPSWKADGERIRVPVNQQGPSIALSQQLSGRQSKKSSLHHATPSLEQVDLDGNDWETVADSLDAFGDGGGMHGYKTTGSSIADTSDDGASFAETHDSSTRIIQHPGLPGYTGPYVQRHMVYSNQPVLLPRPGGHRVNGVMVNSLRTRTQQIGYRTPSPLEDNHANPFTSPPPDVSSAGQLIRDRPVAQFKHRQCNHFPAVSSLTTVMSNDASSPVPRALHIESDRALSRAAGENTKDGSRSPKPPLYPLRSRAYQMGTPGRNTNTPIRGPYMSLGDESSEELRPNRLATKKIRDRSTSDKLPPGGLYNDVRRSSGFQQQSVTHTNSRRPTTTIREDVLPTNQLRPLSLLAPEPAIRPVASTTCGPRGPYQFYVYRSPMAPPRHNEWQQLYSSEHLRQIQSSAQAEGIVSGTNNLDVDTTSSPSPVRVSRYVTGMPALFSFDMENSYGFELAERRSRISTKALIIVEFLPPLLPLFALGYLDPWMFRWSKGDFQHFGIRQKRIAKYSSAVWAVILAVSIIIASVLIAKRS